MSDGIFDHDSTSRRVAQQCYSLQNFVLQTKKCLASQKRQTSEITYDGASLLERVRTLPTENDSRITLGMSPLTHVRVDRSWQLVWLRRVRDFDIENVEIAEVMDSGLVSILVWGFQLSIAADIMRLRRHEKKANESGPFCEVKFIFPKHVQTVNLM